MPRFEVLAGSTVIGHSDLESGDPPMGVACGRFLPASSYSQVQDACVAARDSYQDHLFLSVRLVDGNTLPAQNGVAIIDYSAELGPHEIEVHVVGIGYPLYQELFPSHVAAYESKFTKDV